MPFKCSAPRCTNSNKDGYCFIKFAQDPELRKKWIDAVGIVDWEPSKTAVLCEVHFHSSELFRIGNKKLIKKGAIPSLFCNCQEPMNRKPLAEIQSKNFERQENIKKCKREHVLSEMQEHNYFFSQKRKSTFRSYKKYVHAADCVIMKEPIDIKTLETLPEEKNYTSKSILDIHISSECATNQILCTENVLSPEDAANQILCTKSVLSPEDASNQTLSTESVPSLEEYEILKEKLKMAEEERDILKGRVNDLEKNIAENTEIINTVLNKDQQRAIIYGTTRGSRWSDETIEKGLHLHFACGSHGYNQIIKLVAPFPSLRTLRNKIQDIKFEPGVFEDVFQYLQLIVPHISPTWKICGLVFDEMAIKEQIDFDTNTKAYIGNVTLSSNTDKLASKAILFQLFGLGFHWKQYVAYHFTPSHSVNDAIKEVILEILQKCVLVGLKVIVLVCDMGNRGLLTKLGFHITKANMVYTITHPCDPEVMLQLIPDPVHVFKNLKEMAMENQFIYLPQDVVETYNLPSNVVDMSHIEWLDSYQSQNCMELKLAPKLSKTVLRPNHFSKMKVTSSTRVINYATASALTFLVQKGDGLPQMETTAWFIRLTREWFDIMTGRNLYHAFSFHNLEKYNDTIELLKLVCHVFENMKVGCGLWKPSQTHVILTTKSMIQLQNRLLNEEEFLFFFPGRASQDSLENGFSNIRRGCPKPTALQFKYRLRQMCITGNHSIPTSSYTYDEVPSLLNVLLTKLNEKEETVEKHCDFPKLNDCEPMSETVQQILYRICEYVVFKLKNFIKCENCYLKLQDNSDLTFTPSSLSAFVAISDYTPGAQIRVSKEMFDILEGAERIIWKAKSKLLLLDKSFSDSLISYLHTALKHLPLSTCHYVKNKLISRFVLMRVKQLSVTLSTTEKMNKNTSAFRSKTMGAGLLADRFKQKNYTQK